MTRALACLVIAACSAPATTPTAPTPPTPDAALAKPASPVEVTWSITRERERLRIDYKVTNHLDTAIVLCDRMRDTKGPVDLAVVQPSDIDGVVALTLAFVPPVPRVILERQPRPIAHPLAAKETASGTAYVAWPLAVYHPLYDPPLELPRDANRVVLEVGYVDGASPLETEKLRAQSYEVPGWAALHHQQLARGDVQRLP
jgi:hypothetical protein